MTPAIALVMLGGIKTVLGVFIVATLIGFMFRQFQGVVM